MALGDSVWAIDIGQCALKALRCRAHESDKLIVAEAFDYIEYPKILSQPGSEPAELIADALKQFLSRNSVKGCKVAISVSGQAGLARFIKLPPVETKKIPDIVRYEAKQQIPFDLNDVIWDYQRMGVSSEEEGFALETEVGLFAMKRDAVMRTLEPFLKAGIEVDFVQLAPLALYNYVLFDQLTELPSPEEYDPESPPESIVVISLGTDSTDLVVTNGYRVWQRSVPIGGSHFTKSLTKEMKLTFAKAEHLKRNASQAEDPKAVFQAMRPVFNDLLTELQRSIGYFTSLDRNAKIGRVVAIGNAMKLPGLRRYLSQNLGFEIDKLDEFPHMTGPEVLAVPAFKSNALSFGPCYGLALQALGRAGLRTNLLPREIVRDRLVRRKKPWAIAAAAVLLLGIGISFMSFSMALGTVSADKSYEGVKWAVGESEAERVSREATRLRTETENARNQFKAIDEIGKHLVGNVEGRILWLEVLRVFNDALPRNPDGKRPAEVMERRELYITSVECQQVPDLSQWYAGVQKYDDSGGAKAAAPAAGAEGAPAGPPADAPAPPPEGAPAAEGAAAEGAVQGGPSGPGWVIQINGHHYHNQQKFGRSQIGAEYIRNEFIAKLRNQKFLLPVGEKGATEPVTAKELGLDYVVLVDPRRPEKVTIPDPNAVPGEGGGGAEGGAGKGEAAARTIEVTRMDFRVEMCWKPTPPSERLKNKKKEGEPKPEGAQP